VCAVVKADAYGHGAVECSRALQAEGAKWLGVTSLDEAIPLREAGIESRILLMTGFLARRGKRDRPLAAHSHGLERWHIETLEKAAASGAVRHAVNLKVDTGMGRLGVVARSTSRRAERSLRGSSSGSRRTLNSPGVFRKLWMLLRWLSRSAVSKKR